jgi:hypothetical protein
MEVEPGSRGMVLLSIIAYPGVAANPCGVEVDVGDSVSVSTQPGLVIYAWQFRCIIPIDSGIPATRREEGMEHIQYLVDETGGRTAVVIPVKGNEAALREFLEDLYGHRKIQERAGGETLSKEQLLRGLREDGLL